MQSFRTSNLCTQQSTTHFLFRWGWNCFWFSLRLEWFCYGWNGFATVVSARVATVATVVSLATGCFAAVVVRYTGVSTVVLYQFEKMSLDLRSVPLSPLGSPIILSSGVP